MTQCLDLAVSKTEEWQVLMILIGYESITVKRLSLVDVATTVCSEGGADITFSP